MKNNFDIAAMMQNVSDAIGADRGEGIYLKMKPGTHHLRVVPVVPKFSNGDVIENIPYLQIVQHAFNVVDNSGREATKFVLCLNDVVRRIKTLGKSLVEQGKLTKADLTEHQKNGCPACSAVAKLQAQRVVDTVWKNNLPKTSFTINVLDRGSNTIKVWNMSKKVFQMVVNPFVQTLQRGIDIWDVNSGFDVVVNAEGTGFGRRYTATYQMVPAPINLPQDAVFHDLYQVAGQSYLNYTQYADLVQQSLGRQLDAVGITIPGTSVANVFDQTPQAVPAAVINEVVPVEAKVNKVRQQIGDGLFMEGNKLVDANGKELF